MQFFIILSSCENWVTQIWKILIQLDSPQQYNHFEVQHAYVMIKIKEVMSNPIFLEFCYMFSFQFSMTPVQIHSSHSSSYPSIYLSLFISPFIYSYYPSSHPSSIHLTVHLFKLPLHLNLRLFITTFISPFNSSSHFLSVQFTSSSHLPLPKFFSISSSHQPSLSSSYPTSLSLSHFSSLNYLFISLIFHLTYHHIWLKKQIHRWRVRWRVRWRDEREME